MATEEPEIQPPVFNEWTSLTAAQQDAMEKKMMETKNENNNYISEHPELRLIIAMFLKRAMDERPKDVLRMASAYFTDPGLRLSIEGKTTQSGQRRSKFIQSAQVASQKEKEEMEERVRLKKHQRANTKARAGRRKISRRQSLNMFRTIDKTGDGNLNYLEIKKHLKEVSRSFGIRFPFSAKDFWKAADTDGDMLINPIEFHVLVNRLHGAVEGAKEKLRDGISDRQWDAGFDAEMARIKETPFDWLAGEQVAAPSYGLDIAALKLPTQQANDITADGGGVVAVLTAQSEDGAAAQGVGALCNAIIRRGWVAAPVVYSDKGKFVLGTFLDKCDGVLLRLSLADARAGKYKDLSYKSLCEVVEVAGRTKPVLHYPDALLAFGSKRALPALAQPPPRPATDDDEEEEAEDEDAPPRTTFGLKGSVLHTDPELLLQSLAANLQKGGNGRVLKVFEGSRGDGVSIIRLTTLTEEVDEKTPVSVTNAADGAVVPFTLREFVDTIAGSLPVLEQPFLARVAEGELRINMVGSKAVGLVKKLPANGGPCATSGAGATYTHLPVDTFRYAGLLRRWRKELGAVVGALGVTDVTQLPLVWTADLIGVGKADDGEEEEEEEAPESDEDASEDEGAEAAKAADKAPEPLFKTPPSRYALVDVNCDCVAVPEDNEKLLDTVADVVLEKCLNYMVR